MSDSWDKTVQCAKDEGQVVVYMSANWGEDAAVNAAFNKMYPGVTVTINRMTTPEITERVRAEEAAGSGGADVTLSSDTSYYEGLKADLPSGPHRKVWKGTAWDHGTYISPFLYSLGVAWNTDHVKKPITDLRDVINNPDYNGKVGMIDGTLSSSTAFSRYALEQNWGKDVLPALAKLNPRPYTASAALSGDLAAGEVWIALFIAPGAFERLKEQGAPVDSSIDVKNHLTTFQNYYYFGATQKSTHPCAGAVFLDWVMSKEGFSFMNHAVGGLTSQVYDPEATQKMIKSGKVTDAADIDKFDSDAYIAYLKSLFQH